MKGVILAAGEGTRMAPLSETRPKVLLKVAGKTLLEWNLTALKEHGIKEVTIVASDPKIEEVFGGEWCGIRLIYKYQSKPLGTGHALAVAEVSGKVLVVNGDNIVDANDLKSVIKALQAKNAMGIVAVRKEENLHELGVVVMGSDNKIEKIVEKPTKPPSEYANLGLYAFEEDFLKFLNTGKSKRGEVEITDAITKADEIYGAEVNYWRHMSYPWDLLSANEELLKEQVGGIDGVVEPGATLKGEVYVAEGALVKNGAYIEGPAYIDKNATVGPNCFIRAYTYLDEWVRIGNGVEVKNSVIHDHTYLSHLSYVGDSIIGSYCNLGAGTVCANLRFDNENCFVRVKGEKIDTGRRKLGLMMGDNSQTGINSTINPGKKIGSDCQIGPGVIVARDIPSGSKLYLKQEFK